MSNDALCQGDSGDGSPDKNGSSGGLSMKQAALLVAGEMAGSGVLALPRALVKTGMYLPGNFH